MILIFITTFFSFVALIILHELGHFVLAKSFGVKVEEFGLGYPPRLFGKKIGETIYSLNLLPFGGFVKIYGQEEPIEHSRSFSTKSFWQKSLIILGGVISFWVIAVIILTIVMATGVPTVVDDEENQGLIESKVQIMAVAKDSPAEGAGLKIGDVIKNFVQVKEIQEFANVHKGEEITLTIQRGKEVFKVSLVPRFSPPDSEGPMGVALARTVLKSYPWYQAPLKGISATGQLTWFIIRSWGMVFSSLFQGQGLPAGVEVGGPIKIFTLFTEMGDLGISYFLQFIAIIAVHLALINILPVPALDGGWLMFMIIDRLRKKPLNQEVVRKVSTAFFFLLVGLMIWITIRDIIKLL